MSDPAPLYLGLMSGTSLDGVDCALARFAADGPALIAFDQAPLEDGLRQLLAFSTRESATVSMDALWRADAWLAEAYARSVDALVRDSGHAPEQITAIGMHGQTIAHAPAAEPPYTRQLGDAARLAVRTGIPVVADFRSADVAAGGQGAPLAPLFHQWLFAGLAPIAVLNLGGIANLSAVGEGGRLHGFDTGPANCLLDAWAERCLGRRYDEDGRWAASGRPCEPLLEALMADPFFARPAPKSTGRDYFNLAWLEARDGGRWLAALAEADVQATLLALSARSVAAAVAQLGEAYERVLCCGGGAQNPALMAALQRCLADRKVETTAEHGMPPQAMEAAAFAWLASLRLQAARAALPPLTGAAEPLVLGALHDPHGRLGAARRSR